MKKNDWLLAAGITGLALMILSFQILTGKTDHALSFQIFCIPKFLFLFFSFIHGNPYGTYDLNTDQTVNINESNQIRIQDRTVRMIEADCPDQICVNHLAISRDGESIICLPNKVVIAIEADDTRNEIDSISR